MSCRPQRPPAPESQSSVWSCLAVVDKFDRIIMNGLFVMRIICPDFSPGKRHLVIVHPSATLFLGLISHLIFDDFS